MTQRTPVALPENYFANWASATEESPAGPSGLSSDPFSDSKAPSRVTASGFSDINTWIAESVASADGSLLSDIPEHLSVPRSNKMQKGKSIMRPNYQNDDSSFYNDAKPEEPEKYVTMADFTEFTRRIERAMTIHPRDSASNISITPRFESLKRVEQVRTGNLSRISEVDSTICAVEEPDVGVIGGYQLSPSEKMQELDSHSSIIPVRGLPIMFVNQRLNFLTHVHSALFRLLTDDSENYPSINSLEILLDSRRTWGNEPSTELLEMVVDKTMNKSGIVLANPFKIPILEPGMIMTPKVMHMALDQLHREFEVVWFDTMKSITTPKFQSKYDKIKYRTSRPKGERNNETKHRTSSSSSGRGGSSGRRSSSGNSSILSGFLRS